MVTSLVRFGERQHLVQEVANGIRPVGHPVVAICGTIFVPKTWEPDPDLPGCLGCFESRDGLLLYMIEGLEKELDETRILINRFYAEEEAKRNERTRQKAKKGKKGKKQPKSKS